MKRLFNDGWEFRKTPLFTTLSDMMQNQNTFEPVGLPHDWLIYDTDNLYEDSTGWYRRILEWYPKEDELVFLRFEGIYMDSHIYVNPEENPQPVFEWKYGYSTFEVEITSYLKEGKNEIWVSVDHQSPNSRWYSGAGIYRNVWLKTTHAQHILSDGVYFHAEEKEDEIWEAEISVEVIADQGEIRYELEDVELGSCKLLGIQPVDSKQLVFHTQISNPKIWDIKHPHYYRLKVSLYNKEEILQEEIQTVGFRTTSFTPDQGFCLNGRKVKLNGVCEHHDLGCLGSAFHPQAMRRKMSILKEMGTNAIRLSHNMPAPGLMDLADEMGMLIVSEAFDMWESSKTTYDYGRFFPEWYQKDVASWVRRDRNHPSVILWSIGNEIHDTHAGERGQMWTRILIEETRKHDPLGNALPTIGSNYMPWENAQKCADIIKIAGYNYGPALYDKHHEEHPDWIIYGSETSSVVQSRGIYHFPFEKSILSDDDEQCSSLGNSTTSWGAKSAEDCILAERDHPYSGGQFLWSGFDYIGEPTPYHTRNSYFGQIDTAGFPKDPYYAYQAAWHDPAEKSVLHLFPYWDFNEGQIIDVRAYTNASSVELFVNEKSQGICELDHLHGENISCYWKVPYEKGEIRAVAYDANGQVIAEDSRHSFGEAAEIDLQLSASKLHADGQDLLFVEISMKDANGYPVENANNRVNIQITGSGTLIGTDNGDSTETAPYKCNSRRLFSGKLLAVVKAGVTPGKLEICVSSMGLPSKKVEIAVLPAAVQEGSSELAYGVLNAEGTVKTDLPVRNIYLSSHSGTALNPENPETVVTAALFPQNATDQKVLWYIVDDAGIPSTLAAIEADGLQAKVIAKSDGKFRLRCVSKCGTEKIRIISQLEFSIEGFGTACLDPYGFITGGLYDYTYGEIANGNDHGFSTARAGKSSAGFHNIDFGSYGSDEIFIPIFALSSEPHELKIYEGMYGEENAELIGDFIYQKPTIWNVYQPETYRLKKRLCGVTSISFVCTAKIHVKGFSFTKFDKAFAKLFAGECDQMYGDTFEKDGLWMKGIGNNVTLAFRDMDFSTKGASKITITGKTPLEKNTIILSTASDHAEKRFTLEFNNSSETQTFEIEPVYGMNEIRFIFLPGCQFDFHWFRFEA